MNTLKQICLNYISRQEKNQKRFDEFEFIQTLNHHPQLKLNLQILPLNNDIDHLKNLLRMIKIQKHLNHSNVLKIKDLLATPNYILVETEQMDYSLVNVLKSKSSVLTEHHVKLIFYQMMLSVAYLHSQSIEHLNLHPGSFLVTKDCDVKLTNFLSSHPVFIPKTDDFKSTHQNYYTAPEIILNNNDNSHCLFKSDIWSLGCIFFEMIQEKSHFYHSRYYLDQLKWIFRLLGSPAQDRLDWIKNQSAKKWVSRLKPQKRRSPSSYLKLGKASEKAMDLLDRMLRVNPHERLSVEEVLRHPYFSEIFEESDLIFTNSNLRSDNMSCCHPQFRNLGKVLEMLVMETVN